MNVRRHLRPTDARTSWNGFQHRRITEQNKTGAGEVKATGHGRQSEFNQHHVGSHPLVHPSSCSPDADVQVGKNIFSMNGTAVAPRIVVVVVRHDEDEVDIADRVGRVRCHRADEEKQLVPGEAGHPVDHRLEHSLLSDGFHCAMMPPPTSRRQWTTKSISRRSKAPIAAEALERYGRMIGTGGAPLH